MCRILQLFRKKFARSSSFYPIQNQKLFSYKFKNGRLGNYFWNINYSFLYQLSCWFLSFTGLGSYFHVQTNIFIFLWNLWNLSYVTILSFVAKCNMLHYDLLLFSLHKIVQRRSLSKSQQPKVVPWLTNHKKSI